MSLEFDIERFNAERSERLRTMSPEQLQASQLSLSRPVDGAPVEMVEGRARHLAAVEAEIARRAVLAPAD